MQEKMDRKTVRWHQAFYAGLQIELADDSERLVFVQELILGNEPVRLDMLVIRKTDDIPVSKSIGKIFRKYNVLEYKSPGDSLSIDSFYKACGYSCLYKAITGKADEVKITDMTLTFVCTRYPRKLISHLKSIRKFCVEERTPGIYLISGAVMPMQIVLTKALPRKDYLWLTSLSDHLDDCQEIRQLLKGYEQHKTDERYRTLMDTIVKANWKMFTEVRKTMCDALEELMKDELEQREAAGKVTGKAEEIVYLLSELGPIPETTRQRIMSETNLETLRKWNKAAARSDSLQQFLKDFPEIIQ